MAYNIGNKTCSNLALLLADILPSGLNTNTPQLTIHGATALQEVAHLNVDYSKLVDVYQENKTSIDIWAERHGIKILQT